jgi:ribosomal protein S9
LRRFTGIDYMQQKADLLFAIQAPLDLFQLKNQYDIELIFMGGGLVGQLMLLR